MRKRVLIVDDNAEHCRIFQRAFEKKYSDPIADVKTALDGRDGWNIYVELKPDIVILDVMLPVENGWELCKKIRAKEEELKKRQEDLKPAIIIMVTAIGSNLNEISSPLHGADGYMDKPTDPEDLFRVIKRIESETV